MSDDRRPAGSPEQPGGGRPHRRGAALGLLGLAVVLLAVLGTVWSPPSQGPAGDTAGTRFAPSAIAARLTPGLVDITSTLGYQHGTSAGTGLVLTPSGEVLTNNHVISGATAIRATDLGNGRGYRATVIGYDQSHDIAVLQLRHAAGLATVPLGDSSTVAVGQPVVALGNAGGRGGPPVAATGKVTALHRTITAFDSSDGVSEELTGLIRTDAAIQPGDSGGPLAGPDGKVIGLNTAAARGQRQGAGSTDAFAIPVSRAVAVASQIEAGRPSATIHLGPTAFLGVALAPPGGGQPGGARGGQVAGVVPGSPVARAGLTAGDMITSLGGQPVSSGQDIRQVLVRHHPGQRIQLGWRSRDGRQHTTTLVLATGPAA